MSSPVEPREGMVTVYDSDGKYVGCMGIETWQGLLAAESARNQRRGPDCTCPEYGHGLNLTRVISRSCPVHSGTANSQARPE